MTAGDAVTPETVYAALAGHYGPQHWWPARTRFEVLVGAVLTQNTAWRNVERAIERLRAAERLTPDALLACEPERLEELVRPSGTYRVKARRLRALVQWFADAGGFAGLDGWPTDRLREALLRVPGVGRETADAILVYAFERPVFVVDAYTERVFARLGLISAGLGYERLRGWLEQRFEPGPRAARYNEYHALIVRHAKDVCRPRPRCGVCPLLSRCAFAAGAG